MNFPKELREEIKRKGGRFMLGTLLIGWAVYMTNAYGVVVFRNAAFVVTFIAIFLDYLRLDLRLSPSFFYDQFVMRPCEKIGVHRVTFSCIGSLLAVVFFDFDIAMGAIAMAIYADGLAGIIGTGFGRTKIYNGKSLEGSLTMLIVSLIAGIFFLKNIWLILAMAIIATLLELTVKNYPDDLILPLGAAMGGQLLAASLGLRPIANGFLIGLIYWSVLAIGLFIFFNISLLYKKIRG